MSKAGLKILLISFLALLASCGVGTSEVVNLNSVGLLVNSNTGNIVDEYLIEPGEVFVWSGNRLLTFDLGTHSILLEGNARTLDSINLKYRFRIDYQLQKNQIISLYKKFGNNYEDVFVVPESKRILREAIKRTRSLAEINVESLESSFASFYDSHYLIFVSVAPE